MIKQEFTRSDVIKILINIGALMDIPTGFYIKGARGENILLGGLGFLTGITGKGNTFKSTIMHYMMLSAGDRMSHSAETSMSTYDTEINIHEERLKQLTLIFNNFKNKDIIESGEWIITDRTVYYANEWFEQLKKYLKSKKENYKKLQYDTPFLSRDKVTPLKIVMPTFSEVDSFSRFETEDVAKIQNENELGDSGGNTIHMRQGLAKTRFLMEAPTLAGSCNHFFLMSAHLGTETNMASGPYAPQPTKKLQHMKVGDKIKGVTDNFFFLTNNFWLTVSASPMINQLTKGPEYPKDKFDNDSGDTDLNLVTLRQLRGKSGPSGNNIELVVSQTEGVLPSLTEFNYIKSSDRFGISGSLQNYNLDIYPDVNLSRTSIRTKINSDLKLCRALNITSELCQMHQYYKYLKEKLCTPKELYDDLIKLGYDWNMILSSTRGWWTIEDEKHPLKFLSTLDLLDMRLGLYKPYWLESK